MLKRNGLRTFLNVRKFQLNVSLINQLKCWSCHKELSKSDIFFCPCEKKTILPVNPSLTYFDLFGIVPNYQIDKAKLANMFKQLMRSLHPDKFSQKSQQEQGYSLDQSTQLNKAYSVLQHPVKRGCYILELNKIDFEKEASRLANISDKNEILMNIMELNEELDSVNNDSELIHIQTRLDQILSPLESELKKAFEKSDFHTAIEIISKMNYYKNVDDRLGDLKLKYKLSEYKSNDQK